jgi:CheY-like chemotaxis protein
MIILVVDDYETIRTGLKDFLTSELFSEETHTEVEVLEAEDGKKAVQVIQEHANIDIVVTDQNMPNMTGLELVAWIKAQTRIPVILQSTDPVLIKHEADAFILKGDIEILTKAIRKLCKI